MKNLLACSTAIIAILMLPAAVSAKESHGVRGHVRKDGTYVAPSRATNPDNTRTNNYSSKGNVNPYTGKEGTRDPYKK